MTEYVARSGVGVSGESQGDANAEVPFNAYLTSIIMMSMMMMMFMVKKMRCDEYIGIFVQSFSNKISDKAQLGFRGDGYGNAERETDVPTVAGPGENSGSKKEKQVPESQEGGEGECGGGQDERDFVFLAQLNRPRGWSAWEHRTKQRPTPLHPPRIPDLQYANMSIRAIDDEDGVQIFSQLKDNYMRTSFQLQRSAEAQADQRKVGGGVYTCLEDGQEGFELVLRKGFKSKALGISLRHRTHAWQAFHSNHNCLKTFRS